MGLLSGSSPAVNSEELRDSAQMLKECKVFSKTLKKFVSSVKDFEKASDKLMFSSQGVVQLKDGVTEQMNSVRGGFTTEMSTKVHGPIGEWQSQFKAVEKQYKQLLKLASNYGKSEGHLEKANAKKVKQENNGAPAEKQAKLATTVEVKAQKFEAAKNAFVCTAPQVNSDFRALLHKRDELQSSLFSAFSLSANALQSVANLNPTAKH